MSAQPAPAPAPVTPDPAHDPGAPAAEAPRSPVRAADIALVVLAAIAIVAALHVAAAFFVPVVTGVFIAYTLRPIVEWLARWRVPRWVGASLAVSALSVLAVGGVYSLSDDVNGAIGVLPEAARKVRLAVRESRQEGVGPIASVQKAAKELDAATAEASGARAARPAAEPGLGQRAQAYLVAQTKEAVDVALQLGLAALLALFVLAAGDAFRRKLMRLVGPSLARKRVTMEVLGDIVRQIQRYLAVTLVTNVAIGLATGALLAAAGLDNAAAWGIATGLLHLVPYLGGAIAAGGIAVSGFLQFESLAAAAGLAAGTAVIATVIGLLFQTWLQSRAGNMNTVAVFTSLLFWGWVWGGWGLVLGVPIMAVVKAIADRLAPPVGELLG